MFCGKSCAIRFTRSTEKAGAHMKFTFGYRAHYFKAFCASSTQTGGSAVRAVTKT